MEIFELLEDYLIDQDDGLKKLLTWFLNLVMQLEAIQQSLKDLSSARYRTFMSMQAISKSVIVENMLPRLFLSSQEFVMTDTARSLEP